MTGIVKTDQLQGAQGTTVTIPTGNTLAVTSNATVGGTLGVTGAMTTAAITSTGRHDVNFNGSGTQAFKYTDTGGGNLASFGQFYNTSNALIGNVQNANNDGIHLNIKNGSIVFSNIGYTAANALDDYEEGTFLPRYGGTTSNGTVYYTNMNGVYTKIGRMVRVWIDISVSSASGMSGTPTIYNLPFASANDLGTEAASGNAPINATTRYDMGESVWWDVNTNFTGSRPATGWFTNNVSYFMLYTHHENYYSGHSQMQLNQTGRIACSLTYTTAS